MSNDGGHIYRFSSTTSGWQKSPYVDEDTDWNPPAAHGSYAKALQTPFAPSPPPCQAQGSGRCKRLRSTETRYAAEPVENPAQEAWVSGAQEEGDFPGSAKPRAPRASPYTDPLYCAGTAASAVQSDIFAAFSSSGQTLQSGQYLPMDLVIPDTSESIVAQSAVSILLQPGFYRVSYLVCGSLEQPGELQVIPHYSASPAPLYRAVGHTVNPGEEISVGGTFLAELPAASSLLFLLHSSGDLTGAAVSVTAQKLRR